MGYHMSAQAISLRIPKSHVTTSYVGYCLLVCGPRSFRGSCCLHHQQSFST